MDRRPTPYANTRKNNSVFGFYSRVADWGVAMTNEYKLVPIEPTSSMVATCIGALTVTDCVHTTYKAMLKDAPTLIEVDLDAVHNEWLQIDAPKTEENFFIYLKQKHSKLYAVSDE